MVIASIDGWPNYSVDRNGNIYSSGKKLASVKLSNGYMRVTLCANGEKAQTSVHRIVAETFIRKISSAEVINHKNGDKSDNRVENIEIVTQSQNVKHAYALGLRVINENHKTRAAMLGRLRRTLSDADVLNIRSEFSGKRGDIVNLAARYKTHHKTIRCILDGKSYGDVR